MCNIKSNSEGQHQYLLFNCSANHMKSLLRKLGEI